MNSKTANNIPVVRAIDVGYGHIKFVLSHDVDTMAVKCSSFPSRSPRASRQPGADLSAGVMTKLDTVTVEINGQIYEVGRDVISAASAHDSSETLAKDFAMSDAYMARLYGALSYMVKGASLSKIDYLVLGLPNMTFHTMAKPLSEKIGGKKHVINTMGCEVEIDKVLVFPQPMGAFFDHGFREKAVEKLGKSVNLIVDPGYNTLDWLFTQGLSPSAARSGSVALGMSAVIRAVGEEMLSKEKKSANIDRVINRIDAAILQNAEYRLSGQVIDLKKYMPAGRTVIEQGINAIHKSVGDGDDIDNIFIAGGGSSFFYEELSARYPDHHVIKIENPQFANVRGFQFIGNNKAQSAMRARGIQ